MPHWTGTLGLGDSQPLPGWLLPEMTPVPTDGRSATSKTVAPLRLAALWGQSSVMQQVLPDCGHGFTAWVARSWKTGNGRVTDFGFGNICLYINEIPRNATQVYTGNSFDVCIICMLEAIWYNNVHNFEAKTKLCSMEFPMCGDYCYSKGFTLRIFG